ncbi:hypothetical protein GCM10011613_01160 [Cellvibrio zantedeschiae]|uniref:Type IV secretion system coupling protein TraD DNA-binding domain-containing protein n=1 Tax=Cellvibrio zantedeschiae TaxID=1237077 RepID=A0ABQ3APR5_9GAMM|nr:type IV secretion system DNA-binding domain-containing protein [Cellvibrio zantedeschiae]GGY61531.1 hypothetical protein GCM10011613_01160 [Cellvibrio zantedeschiae]
MNPPHNKRYQLWPQMVVLFAIFFLAQSIILWNTTWGWFDHSDWGSFKKHYPFILTIFGKYIPFVEFQKWLIYWNNLGVANLRTEFILHLTLPIIFSFVTSFLFVRQLLWVEGGRERVIHIKGPLLLEGNRAERHARASHQRDLKANLSSKKGIYIHPKISLCTQREQASFGIVGATGGGKSTVFKPLVSQAISRGDYAIIYDEKGEYTSSFYNSDTTHLIAAWDERSACWNIFLDVGTKHQAELLALCLIPDRGGKDAIWFTGARMLFVGMILVLLSYKKPWGWKALSNMLSTPQDQMLELLNIHHPIAASFIKKESVTTQGFYVNLTGELSWIEDLAIAWPRPVKGGFSVKKWVSGNDPKKVIIIQSDPRFDSIGAPLCNAIVSLITRNFLALEENIERKTWLFIDEFANLPRNPMIKKWLELARSRGARSVICTQSISQIREIYGANDTDTILNLLSNIISLRIGSGGDEAKYISRIFGERIVERPNSSDANATWVRTREQLVEDFELTQLKPASNKGVEGYLFVPGWQATYKLVWPIYKANSVAKRHCPAKWIEAIAPKENTKSPQTNRLNKRGIQC